MIRTILLYLVNIYVFALLGRIVIDLVMSASQSWRPRGVVLGLVELVLTITDPPLKFIRRKVPPLRIGMVALDLSFLILLFAIQLFAPLLIAFVPF